MQQLQQQQQGKVPDPSVVEQLYYFYRNNYLDSRAFLELLSGYFKWVYYYEFGPK